MNAVRANSIRAQRTSLFWTSGRALGNLPLKLSTMAMNDLCVLEITASRAARCRSMPKLRTLVQEHTLFFRERHEVFSIAAVRG
jgi:hypothetical protein